MCEFKILQESEYGITVRCEGCRHIQLTFGTTAIAFTDEQFYEFANVLRAYKESYWYDVSRDKKLVRIPSTTHSIQLVYTLNEVDQLLALIEGTHFSIEIEKMLLTHEN